MSGEGAKKQIRGRVGEDHTAARLSEQGYTILARNFRRRGGEIDIAAEKDGELVFVEVKTRRFGSMTDGAEAVGAAKRRRVILTALKFAEERGLSELPMRFDISEVTVTTEDCPRVLGCDYFEDAFDAGGLGII